jgi:3-hydroxypropanoate dehydrogenase
MTLDTSTSIAHGHADGGSTHQHEPFLLDPVAQDALFRSARSVRAWADRPVTDEHVAAVYELLRWGPTAMNASPLRLLLVRGREARERLARHMDEGNRERVLGAPLTLVVAADTNFHRTLGHLAPHLTDAEEHFGPDVPGRERIARENAWLQAGYLVVALRGSGLDVGPMGGMDADAVDAELFAGTGCRSLMVLNVGWPAQDPDARPRAARLAFEQVARSL